MLESTLDTAERVLDLITGLPHIRDKSEIWQDRSIRFDVGSKDLKCRAGEAVVDIIEPIEDTKGNNGIPGELWITNLRVIWIHKTRRSTNISVGLGCFINVSLKSTSSRLKGETDSLVVLTKYANQRYEFLFTSLSSNTNQLLMMVQQIFYAYDQSRLYRDLKLRGSILQEGELILLPLEQTYSKVNGVWNLSSDQGNLGSFFVSNVRVVWYSHLSSNYNVSIPYLQMKSVKIRNSRFGPVLVIESTEVSGAYILGFKVDPQETLDYVFKEISSLWKTYTAQPIFGIECDFAYDDLPDLSKSSRIQSQEEDVELINPTDKGDFLATYYADGAKASDRDPVFCPELGLAIEPVKEGHTVGQLWSVV